MTLSFLLVFTGNVPYAGAVAPAVPDGFDVAELSDVQAPASDSAFLAEPAAGGDAQAADGEDASDSSESVDFGQTEGLDPASPDEGSQAPSQSTDNDGDTAEGTEGEVGDGEDSQAPIVGADLGDADVPAAEDESGDSEEPEAGEDAADESGDADDDAFDPTDAPLVEPVPVDEGSLMRTFGASVAVMAAEPQVQADDEVLEIGTSRISAFKGEWLSGDDYDDGDSANLALRRGTNEPFSARFRITLSLAGMKAYAPGEIALTIPKALFRSASGAELGSMALAVPAAPDATAAYAYSELPDAYLITNMRAISGTGTSTFEFTISGVRPAQLTDMAVHGPFVASASVTVEGGRLSASSNGLTATVDTSARASGASMTIGDVKKDPSAVPAALIGNLKGSRTDFYYVDYYTSVNVTATQESSLAFRFEESSGIAGAQVLGSIAGAEVINSATDSEGYRPFGAASYNNGAAGYVHTWVAYPISSLPDDVVHTFKGTVSYKVTSASDREVTTTGTTRTRTYVVRSWQEPSTASTLDKRASASYPVGASSLRTGESVAVTFSVAAKALTMPYTRDDADKTATGASDYGKRDVSVLVSDPGPSLAGQGTLTREDTYLSRLRFDAPQMKAYSRVDGGSFDYVNSGSVSAPTFTVQAQSAAGQWTDVATLSWSGGKPSFSSLAPGVSASEGTLTFAADSYIAWRVSAVTRAAGMEFSIYPTYLVKASSAKVRSALIAAGESGSIFIENKASMDLFAGASATGTPVQTVGSSTARAELGILAWGSIASATAAQKSVDRSGQAFRVAFTATARTDTNTYTEEDYEDAVEAGIVTRQQGGIFYDLLPAGVVPDLSTVRAVNGDSVLWARTYENWRGSDRTMLVARTAHVANVQKDGKGARFETVGIAFEGTYSWKDANDRGSTLRHVVAYQSDAGVLGNQSGRRGEPDDPRGGMNASSSSSVGADYLLMKGLSETGTGAASDANSFLYASGTCKVTADFYSVIGFSVAGEVNGDGRFSDGSSDALAVNDGGTYRYRIRTENDDVTKSTGIVLFDALDEHLPDGVAAGSTWRGTLLSVDVSAAKRAGADPKVYYSTVAGLDFSTTGDHTDLSNSAVWSATAPADLSQVRAIAVDCTKAADGSDFVLGAGKGLEAFALMRAPQASQINSADPGSVYAAAGDTARFAYNAGAALVSRISPTGEVTAPAMDYYAYVKVGLRAHSVSVQKVWDDGDDSDSLRTGSVTVHLLRDGVPVSGASQELSDANGWKWDVPADLTPAADDAGHQYAYSFGEDAVEGYEPLVSKTVSGGEERFTLTNYHELARVSVSGTKIWDDDDDAAGRRANEVFMALQASVDGGATWTEVARKAVSGDTGWAFEFKRLVRMQNGQERLYRVVEDYVPGYARSYDVADAGEDATVVTVTNTYDPFGDLVVRNTMTGTTAASEGKVFTYTIAFADENGDPVGDTFQATVAGKTTTLATGSTFVLAKDQEARIVRMPSEMRVTVTQSELPGFSTPSGTLSGSVHAGDGLTLDFQNRYVTRGTLYLQAAKQINGGALPVPARTFTFHASEDGNVVRTAQASAGGNIDFGAIRYDASDDGVTHTYTIAEVDGGLSGYTYDATVKTAHATATDNGDGTMKVVADAGRSDLVFENGYEAKGDLALRAWKSFPAWTEYVRSLCTAQNAAANAAFFRQSVPEGWFAFELLDGEGNPVTDAAGQPIVATNAADGTINVPAATIDQGSIGKTLVFRLAERPQLNADKVDADGTALGITDLAAKLDGAIAYDEKPVEFLVAVADNGDGTLSFDAKAKDDRVEFENALKEGDLVISKTIEGYGYNPDQVFEFTVHLKAPAGTELPETLQLEYSGEGIETVDALSVATADLLGEPAVVVAAAGADVPLYDVPVAPTPVSETSATQAAVSADTPVNAPAPAAASADVAAVAEDDGADQAPLRPIDEVAAEEQAAGAVVQPKDDDLGYGSKTDGDNSFTWAVRADGTLVLGAAAGSTESQVGCVGSRAPWPSENVVRVVNACPVKLVHDEDTCSIASHNLYSSSNRLFYGHGKLTDISALAEWDVSGAEYLPSFFSECTSLKDLAPLSDWDVSNVKSFSYMFRSCESLEDVSPIGGWNVSSVEDAGYLFWRCASLKDFGALGGWDTSSFINLEGMFMGTGIKTLDGLEGWRFPNAYTTNSMFSDCHDLESIEGLREWNLFANYVSEGQYPSQKGELRYMFDDCWSLESVEALETLDTSKMTDFSSMFNRCKSLKSLKGLEKFEFGRVYGVDGLRYMFSECTSLESLEGTEGWKFSGTTFGYDSYTSLSYMFSRCSNLKDISAFGTWNVEDVGDITYMFQECTSLESLEGLEGMEFGKNITGKQSSDLRFSYMFDKCSNLKDVDSVSTWTIAENPKIEYLTAYNMFSRTHVEKAPNLDFLYEPGLSLNVSTMFDSCPLTDATALHSFRQKGSCTYASILGNSYNVKRVALENETLASVFTSLPPFVKNRTFTKEGSAETATLYELLTRLSNQEIEGVETWYIATDYTVSFDANGASGSMSDVVWGTDLVGTPAPASTFVYPGHVFLGWSTTRDGSAGIYKPGSLVPPLTDKPGAHVTLYAQWYARSSEIPVSKDGGATICLKGGQSVSIKGLPAGCAYSIEEAEVADWYLDSKTTGASGTVAPAGETQARFNNYYSSGSCYVTVRAQKAVSALGPDANLAGYCFELKQGDRVVATAYSDATGRVTFSPQSVYGNTDWTLSENEDKSSVPADLPMAFDDTVHAVHVEVTTVPTASGDRRTAVVTYDGASTTPTFNNGVEGGTLTVTKAADPSVPADKEFTYMVTTSDGRIEAFRLHAGESKVLEGLTHGATYTVTESDPGSGYTAAGERVRKGSIFGGQAAEEVFSDAYAASGSFQVQVSKQYLGETLEAGMFLFELLSADDPDTVLDTATNLRDGSVTFGAIEVDAPGTYRYFVREVNGGDDRVTYDAGQTAVTVRATDNGDGTIACDVALGGTDTFVNSVETARLTLTTTMEGHSPVSEGRTFSYRLELTDRAGSSVDAGVAVSPVSGSRAAVLVRPGDVFEVAPGEPVVLELPLDAEYRIVQLEAPGFETTSEGSAGALRAGDEAEAVFRNVYSAEGTATVRAAVRLEGGELSAGQFAFQLLDAEGNVLEEVRNGAAAPQAAEPAADPEAVAALVRAAEEPIAAAAGVGEVVFSDIPLTVDDHGRVRSYTLRQVDEGLDGVVYDLRDVQVQVVAADDGAGTLGADTTYDGAPSAEFVNRIPADKPEGPDDPQQPQEPQDPEGPGTQEPDDPDAKPLPKPEGGQEETDGSQGGSQQPGGDGSIASAGDGAGLLAASLAALGALALAAMLFSHRRTGRGRHSR